MFDVITIGSATRDVFITSPDFVILKDERFQTGSALAMTLGTKIHVDKIVMTPGGGATNVAIGLSRQGLAASCVAIIGKDIVGEEIKNALNAENVDTRFFVTHGDDLSGYSTILFDGASGERTIVTYKGEGQHFSKDTVDVSKLDAKWIFVDNVGGNIEFIGEIINHARDRGIKLATNPGTLELALGFEKLQPLLSACEIVLMNQEEASLLSGIDYNDEAGIFKFMDEKIGGIFVMTKGRAGVSVSDGKNIYRAGIPDSPVVERTGAGDAFSSGFISEYIRSGDIQKSIQMATANSSSVVTKYGPIEGLLKEDNPGQWPLVDVEIK